MARYDVVTTFDRNGAACLVLSSHRTFRAAGDACRKLKRWAERTGCGSGNAVIRDNLDGSVWNPGGVLAVGRKG